MKTLLEDYQRRLVTVDETVKTTKNTGSLNDIEKMTRLRTKASEYRTFIVEIQRAIEREKGEEEPTKRLEKLEKLSFADLRALNELCINQMAYQQRRFPKNKKANKELYDEQYELWLEWYGLNTAVTYVINEFVKKLQAK